MDTMPLRRRIAEIEDEAMKPGVRGTRGRCPARFHELCRLAVSACNEIDALTLRGPTSVPTPKSEPDEAPGDAGSAGSRDFDREHGLESWRDLDTEVWGVGFP